jgi:predicted RNA-binding Zn-ribbon protein involved in translation (DUF1610 family)
MIVKIPCPGCGNIYNFDRQKLKDFILNRYTLCDKCGTDIGFFVEQHMSS